MTRCASTVEAMPGGKTLVTCDREDGHEGDHHGVSREHSEHVELSWTDAHERKHN
jgi:hypothetical protein